MRALVLVLVLPVVLGQAARRLPGVPAGMARHRVVLGAVARLLVASVLIAAAVDAASQAELLSAGLVLATLAVCGVVHLTGLLLGLWGGRLLGLARADRIAVAFAGSQKTLPVALFLYGAYYRGDYPLAVLPLLLYHAAQLLVDTLIADRLAAGPDRNTEGASAPG
jgi:sodium/bile acid cotransporter 7